MNIQELISPATLRRILHYAEVVEKSPRIIIDRELNKFMDEKGEYTMQQLAMMDRKNRRKKKSLEQQRTVCINTNPGFSPALFEEKKVATAP